MGTPLGLHDGRGEKIRLYGINAPEKGQAFGNRAKQFVSSLAFGKEVKVEVKDQDRNGRTKSWSCALTLLAPLANWMIKNELIIGI